MIGQNIMSFIRKYDSKERIMITTHLDSQKIHSDCFVSGQNIMISGRKYDSGERIRITKNLNSQKIHLDLRQYL